jgi:hypothetical protein
MIYWHIAPFAAANQERQRGSPQMALCQEDVENDPTWSLAGQIFVPHNATLIPPM